jgi:hypothetical protein
MASALVTSAAEMMFGIFKYESLLGGGPMQTASSAKRTISICSGIYGHGFYSHFFAGTNNT